MRWETDLLNVGNGHRKKRDEVGNGRYEVRNGRTRWETDMRVCICTYFKYGWYLQPMASLVNVKCPILARHQSSQANSTLCANIFT